jgi:hypothetical protein
MFARISKWLPVALALAGFTLSGLPRSAEAAVIPTIEVSIAVVDPTTGLLVAPITDVLGSGAGQTPPFSPNSSQVMTMVSGLGGVSSTAGQHTADNNYPDTGALGVNQYIESVVRNVTNGSTSPRTVYLVVSGSGFQPANGGTDKVAGLNVGGTFINSIGSSIQSQWFIDSSATGATSRSNITGAVGTAPTINLLGTQVGTTFNFTSTQTSDAFSGSQNNIPVNLTGPFGMTLVTTETLPAGAVLSNRTMSMQVSPAVPEPGIATMALCLIPVAAVGAWRRLRRKSD